MGKDESGRMKRRELGEDVLEDGDVGCGAGWALWMCIVAREPSAKFEELGGGMFVGWHGITESNEAQILQDVVQFVKTRVAFKPEFVSQGEVIGCEGGDAKQIIRAVHDHVNGEVVAGEYFEIRSDFVA